MCAEFFVLTERKNQMQRICQLFTHICQARLSPDSRMAKGKLKSAYFEISNLPKIQIKNEGNSIYF
jgi:hypothetical protein